MIPKLDSLVSRDGFHAWITTDGVVGIAVHANAVDVEMDDAEAKSLAIAGWLKSLDVGLIVKVEAVCEARTDFTQGTRTRALEILGAKSFSTTISVQSARNLFLELIYKKKSGVQSSFERVKRAIETLRNFGIEFRPLSECDSKGLFHDRVSSFSETLGRIDTGSSVIGALRLYRQSATPLSESNVSDALRLFPPPFRFVTSFKRMDRARAELLLQKRLKQESSATGKLVSLKQDAVELTLVSTNLEGRELFEFETSVLFERSSEKELRNCLAESAPVLQRLGDVIVETVGVAPTFVASLPGAGLHLPLLESDSALPLFLPIFRAGETGNHHKASFRLHRRDGSIGHVDLLNRNEQNSNAVILGASGRGKSAFLGCLTETLMADPTVRMIKVDVGGSHSRECELLGGKEYRLSLETAEGLNPFALIRSDDLTSESVRSIVSQFVEQLVLEEGEIRLSKSLRLEIDDKIAQFLVRDSELSIDGLLEDKTFPRWNLLSRWGSNGLYGRAFRTSPKSEDLNERLRYFNFQEIFQAADPDFAQAVMASVLALFNLELRRYPNSRLVLVCDETPFFVERCFDFFKLSTANVRKFGAAVILVAQLSKHLVVRGDTGLIENTHHRFLFSADGSLSDFQERMRLSDKQMALLSGLEFQSRRFSELIYQMGSFVRVLRLRMSAEEYWRVSSTQGDRVKIELLKKAVPTLTTEEAIRCLSIKEAL